MNFPLVWHSFPSGLTKRDPSPVLLYRLPWLSQHPLPLQLLNGTGDGDGRGSTGCRASSCSCTRRPKAAPLPSYGGPIWIGGTAIGDPPPVNATGAWAVASEMASVRAAKTTSRFTFEPPFKSRRCTSIEALAALQSSLTSERVRGSSQFAHGFRFSRRFAELLSIAWSGGAARAVFRAGERGRL